MADFTVSREQLLGFRAQVDAVLGRIEQTLETEALVADLPIVGTALGLAYQQGQAELRSFERLITGLSSVLQSLANAPAAPASAEISGGPRAPLSAGMLAATVANALNAEIRARGFSGVAGVTSDSAGGLYLNLNTAYHPAAYVQSLSTTLGTGSLGLSTQGSASLTLGYDLNVTFAVNALGASSGVSGTGFKATIDTSAVSFTGSAVLGPARFQATDLGSGIHGAFTILTDGSPATFTGTADLDVHLRGDLGNVALPSISTDLDIAWALNNAATGPTSTGPFGTVPTVSFNNVTWDLGQFFDDVVKPALDAIRPLVAPVRTLLNVLTTDLVVVKSILGYGWHILDVAGDVNVSGQPVADGKVTLLDFIRIAAPGSDIASITRAVGVINAITTVVEALELLNDATAYYNLGSFTFNADIRQAAFVLAQAVPVVTQPAANLANALQGLANGQTSAANVATVAQTLTQLTTTGNSIFASGLSQGPAFASLLGAPTDLFRVSVPSFTLGFGSIDAAGAPTGTVNLGFFPLVPFIDASLDAALQATLAFNFGYDTSGLIAYANGNFSDPTQALNGLWVSNPDDVLSTALLRIAGSVGFNINAGIRPVAQISGGGDIGGEVEFFLPQAGRNYLSDLQRYVQNGTFFATRGELTAGFNASVNVINPIGGGTIRLWDAHSDRLTLASYNQLAAPLPASAPVALSVAVLRLNDVAGTVAGVLVAGDSAKIRVRFDLPVDVRGVPTLTLDDGGLAVFDGAATLALGDSRSLVFTHTVRASDTSTPALTVQGVGGGGTIVEAGVPDGLPARSADLTVVDTVVLNNVRVDTAITRTFIDPAGDGADASHWDVPFVNVSGPSTQGPGGQLLSINYYGNAVIAAGNAATFASGIARAESVDVRLGSLLTIGGGTVDVTGSYKQDSTVTGTLRVLAGGTWQTDDHVANAGLIDLAGGGQPARWAMGKFTTLSGGGTVRLGGAQAGIVAQAPLPGATPNILSMLNNTDNRIEGSGTIGSTTPDDDALGITNLEAGTVVATGATELRILNSMNNAGALGAIGAGAGAAPAGGLRLLADLYNYASGATTDGTLSAVQGGRVILDGMTVTRGGLATADSGLITTAGAAAIAAPTPMSLRARIVVGAGSTLTMTGSFTQAVFEEAPANGARLSAGTGTLMLDGVSLTDGLIASEAGGTVHVANSVTLTGTVRPGIQPGLVTQANLVTDAGSSLRLAGAVANRGSISGAAAISGSGALRNSGSIAAASIATGGSVNNAGTVALVGGFSAGGQADNTGTVTAGGSFSADGGLINQGSISAVTVRIGGGSNTAGIAASGSVAIGGTFGNIGTITAGTGVSLSGSIGNHGTVAGASFALSGTIDNTAGVLRVANGGRIDIADGTTIKGGTLRAVGGAQADAAMIAVSGAVTLDGTGEQVNNFGLLTASLVSDRNGPIANRTLRLTGVVNQYSSPTLAGEIVANDETVVLDSATLQNGTLRQVGTGRFSLQGSSVLDGTSHGLTLPGQLTIGTGQAPTVRGVIVNAGSVSIDGYRDTGVATLRVSGTARLSGGGTVALRDAYPGYFGGTARIVGAGSGDVLENVDNAIGGYGELGAGSLALRNAAGGSVTAAGSALRLYLGAGSSNRGLLQSTTGTLMVGSTIDNAGGRIAANGGRVQLGAEGRAATIAGGTLQTGGGVMAVNAAGATLDGTASAVTNAGTLQVEYGAALTLAGAIVNTGTLLVDGYRDVGVARLRIAGAARLSGGGTVTLRDGYTGYFGGTARVGGASTADTLTNADNAIAGYGELGDGALTFVNEAAGLVTASGSTLRVHTGTTLVNRGLMQATTGTLVLETAVANAGGRIVADGATVQLGGDGRVARVVGGALGSTGTSRVTVQQAVLDGTQGLVSSTAAILVENSRRLTLTGAIANAGTIAVDGYRDTNVSTLGVAGMATLSGGGTVTLRDSYPGFLGNTAVITGASTADVLDNVDNAIVGYGQLGAGKLRFINEAAGVVRATTSTLTVDTGGEAIVNRGLLESAGGTLALASAVSNSGRILAGSGTLTLRMAVANTGSILAGDGGTLVLDGASISGGGRLGSTGLGTVRVASASTIDGGLMTTELAGALSVAAGATLTLMGGVSNAGSVSIDGYRYTGVATLRVSGTARLSGGGAVALRDAYPGYFGGTARIVGAGSGDVLENVDNAIGGYGELGAGSLALRNAAGGSVTAAGSALRLYLGAGSSNRGLLQSTTGTLMVGSTIDNAGGRIAANGGRVQLGAEGRAATIAGGTLQTGGGVMAVNAAGATLDGTASAVTNAGTLQVEYGAALTLAGAIVNTGTLLVDGYRDVGVARLRIAGAVRLSGGGTVTLRDGYTGFFGGTAQVDGAGTADVLTNADNVIAGYGGLGLGRLAFINEAAGVVRAAGSTLTIDTAAAAIVNRGVLEAAGGTLSLASAVDNAGGRIEARAGTVTLAGKVTGGTLKVGAGQRMNVNGGMSGSLLDLQGENATMAIAMGGQAISGVVKGLDASDRLEFSGISATGTYAGGVLTLKSGDATVGSLVMAGAAETDTFVAQSNGAGGTRIVQQTIAPTNNDIRFTNVVTNTSGRDLSETYSGPVDYLQRQYIWASPDVVAMSAYAPNTFIKGGNGGDAILVTGGQNVLDGGGGSNFLIGGDGSDGGKDVFFVDARENLVTWSTIVNFHKGDLATIFGFRDGISTRPFTDNDGAAGFTGVTIHSETNGVGTGIKGSMTFAGIDRATAEAHFEITTGTLPGDIGYMLIEYK